MCMHSGLDWRPLFSLLLHSPIQWVQLGEEQLSLKPPQKAFALHSLSRGSSFLSTPLVLPEAKQPEEMEEAWTMIVKHIPDSGCSFSNCAYCNPEDSAKFRPDDCSRFKDLPSPPRLARLSDNLVLSIHSLESIPKGYIGMNSVQRNMANVGPGMQISISRFIPPENFNFTSLTLDVTPLHPGSKEESVDADSLCDHIRSINAGQVLSIEQQVKFEYNKNPYVFKVKQGVIEGQKDLDGMQLGMISAETCMIFETSDPRRVKILNQHEPSSIFRQKEFDFQSLGVGTDESFNEAFLRIIASRMYHPRVARKYGVRHVKGFLIQGPSGTGKTLLGRTLGVILKNTKMVNARDLLGKSVDESVQNIRDLFADAERDKKTRGDNSDLHIIIIDEIDAIWKSNSTAAAGAQVLDSISNELLSKLDGLKSPNNNVLLIGLTNQRDTCDETLVRPGRFETVVKVSYPSEEVRLQILEIHTRKMRQNSLLAQDVDLDKLAHHTAGYSGAMLELLVKGAVLRSFFQSLNLSGLDLIKLVDEEGMVEVTMDDFSAALTRSFPAYGVPDA